MQNRTRRWCTLIAALLTAAAANPLCGQVSGTVVDPAGRPVPGAQVELWAGSRRIAGTESGDDGAFRLSSADAQPPFVLSVRRVGMKTRTVDIASADTALVIRLEVQTIVLAPVVAAAERRICPNREEPRARAVWERMRTRYWRGSLDSIAVFSLGEFQSGVAPKAEMATHDARVLLGWTESRENSGVEWVIGQIGYAQRAVVSAGERTALWDYANLDGTALQHFVRDRFGAGHTMSLVSATPERMVIAFCPRGRLGRNGLVHGTLTLNPDTTLRGARWSFRTREPDEDAGGEAHYLAPDPRMDSLLLAEETLFWRRARGGQYYFERRRNSGWRFLDGTFVPREAAARARNP